MIRKCTSAGDDRGKKRKKTTQPRLTKADWFVCFAWVIHDSRNHVFRCKVCVHAKAKNVFVTGTDCAKPKKIWQNTRYMLTTGDRRYCRSARDRWTRSLRTFTRSRRLSPICGPRKRKRSIVSRQLRTFSYEEASRSVR